MWKICFCILAITSSVFNILLRCPTERFPFVAISKALHHPNKNCNLYNSLRVTKYLKYSPASKPNLDRYVFLKVNENTDGVLVEEETLDSG
jgi:hypothetical protein